MAQLELMNQADSLYLFHPNFFYGVGIKIFVSAAKMSISSTLQAQYNVNLTNNYSLLNFSVYA